MPPIFPARLIQVQLPSLRGEDKYRLSFFRALDPLVQSLQAVGQTAPLLGRETGDGLELFSGFLRREAMLKLGEESAMALVWPEDELNELTAFRFAFFENAFARGLNLAEQAKAVNRLKEFQLSDQEIALSYFQKAGIPVSVKGIGWLNLFFGLDPDWKKYLTEKELSLKHLAWFLNLPEKDQAALKILLELKPTSSQLRQILEMTEEIIKRDQIPLPGLIKSLGMEAILKGQKLNANQRLEKLIRAMQKLRFPEWEKLGSRHQALLNRMKIPGEVKLLPMDYFEEPRYRLEMILKQDQEAGEIFEQLLKASRSLDWKKLFDLEDED